MAQFKKMHLLLKGTLNILLYYKQQGGPNIYLQHNPSFSQNGLSQLFLKRLLRIGCFTTSSDNKSYCTRGIVKKNFRALAQDFLSFMIPWLCDLSHVHAPRNPRLVANNLFLCLALKPVGAWDKVMLHQQILYFRQTSYMCIFIKTHSRYGRHAIDRSAFLDTLDICSRLYVVNIPFHNLCNSALLF